jgi:hypothetical protein
MASIPTTRLFRDGQAITVNTSDVGQYSGQGWEEHPAESDRIPVSAATSTVPPGTPPPPPGRRRKA